MKVLDMHWQEDGKWFYFDGLVPKIKEDAPEEVKASFENYKRQIAQNNKN